MTVPSAFTASLSPDERAASGRNARRRAPRSSHGWYETAQQRPDPIEVVERQSAERVAESVPIRHGRMLQSPFRFYRGAAAIMAAESYADRNERDFAALEDACRSGRIRAERL
ncbi:hypothetical protein STRIP9103_05813 [Streptomyces ipomoeae 91-03]|jgi:hypothetical protein|uniref:Uncharacterized protein n=1 Tax=Streptomyces ipomoeae 91-03 TaxID=698759 RepID=L1L393_9ACTN|nr:hypothetical protein STRIP9103_05813 [Streptomyces ipomoeae 91-03]